MNPNLVPSIPNFSLSILADVTKFGESILMGSKMIQIGPIQLQFWLI